MFIEISDAPSKRAAATVTCHVCVIPPAADICAPSGTSLGEFYWEVSKVNHINWLLFPVLLEIVVFFFFFRLWLA